MGVLIDANTIPSVFGKAGDRDDFRPILAWIIKGKAKVIVGGSTYRDELKEMSSYLKLFAELSKLRKVHSAGDADVDLLEAKIKADEKSRDFDDPHLIAIVICSGCRVLCTNDVRCFKFVTNAKLYPKSNDRPSIYTNCGNHRPAIKLLTDKNLSPKCEPHVVLPSNVADKLYRMLA